MSEIEKIFCNAFGEEQYGQTTVSKLFDSKTSVVDINFFRSVLCFRENLMSKAVAGLLQGLFEDQRRHYSVTTVENTSIYSIEPRIVFFYKEINTHCSPVGEVDVNTVINILSRMGREAPLNPREIALTLRKEGELTGTFSDKPIMMGLFVKNVTGEVLKHKDSEHKPAIMLVCANPVIEDNNGNRLETQGVTTCLDTVQYLELMCLNTGLAALTKESDLFTKKAKTERLVDEFIDASNINNILDTEPKGGQAVLTTETGKRVVQYVHKQPFNKFLNDTGYKFSLNVEGDAVTADTKVYVGLTLTLKEGNTVYSGDSLTSVQFLLVEIATTMTETKAAEAFMSLDKGNPQLSIKRAISKAKKEENQAILRKVFDTTLGSPSKNLDIEYS